MDGLRRPSRRDVSADPGWAEKRRKQRGIGAALMYMDVLNAAIAGCKRAALWYLFVAVDKKVLGAVVER